MRYQAAHQNKSSEKETRQRPNNQNTWGCWGCDPVDETRAQLSELGHCNQNGVTSSMLMRGSRDGS